METENSHSGASSSHQAAVRVLVVDDEPAACKLLSVILAPPDFSCSSAGNGEEALVALQREEFHAVISDLHMPGIDGLKLLTEVRPPLSTYAVFGYYRGRRRRRGSAGDAIGRRRLSRQTFF